ncbi:MAG: hypothetical protein A3J28_09110 [Acidobacteria bacterium RIFCSPLOWO2_12_FULL_60_22]|nr:MAG: hypothetical protein A3J28_09110 [Acidobacteria bacterium RIFCSPLOWO2_12_FULL_60_22]
MLGELLGEEKGKITGYRVVQTAGAGQKVEVSFQGSGKLLGIEIKEIATYASVMKPGGYMFGSGQGIIMTKDGESVCWVGQGTGRHKPGGGMSWRGAVYYETASQKLARLNGAAVVYEHDTDAHDNFTTKFWEWK